MQVKCANRPRTSNNVDSVKRLFLAKKHPTIGWKKFFCQKHLKGMKLPQISAHTRRSEGTAKVPNSGMSNFYITPGRIREAQTEYLEAIISAENATE